MIRVGIGRGGFKSRGGGNGPPPPPFSAGAISASPGVEKVTVNRTVSPNAPVTLQTLYRSTAAGVLGAPVLSFVGSFPFVDNVPSGASYHYTLRVTSAGGAVADTPQIGAVPQAAGGGGADPWSTAGMTVRAQHNFSDGLMGPFAVSPSYQADVSVVEGPPGMGMSAQLRYHRPPGAVGSRDVNRSFGAPNMHLWGVTWGWRIRMEGTVYLPRPHLDVDGGLVDYQSTQNQQKLGYWYFDNYNNNHDNLAFLLDGGPTWESPQRLRIVTGIFNLPESDPRFNRFHDYTGIEVPWETPLKLAFDQRINHKGVADGSYRFYINDALVRQRNDYEAFLGGAYDEVILGIQFGQQQQCNIAPELGNSAGGNSSSGCGFGAFDWLRFWTDVSILTQPPGE